MHERDRALEMSTRFDMEHLVQNARQPVNLLEKRLVLG